MFVSSLAASRVVRCVAFVVVYCPSLNSSERGSLFNFFAHPAKKLPHGDAGQGVATRAAGQLPIVPMIIGLTTEGVNGLIHDYFLDSNASITVAQ